MEDPFDQLEPEWSQLERILLPLRRDLREYAACWARVLSFFVPGLGHIFVGSTGFGLLYVTMDAAAVAMIVVRRGGVWWPGALCLALVWAVSLWHINGQTKVN